MLRLGSGRPGGFGRPGAHRLREALLQYRLAAAVALSRDAQPRGWRRGSDRDDSRDHEPGRTSTQSHRLRRPGPCHRRTAGKARLIGLRFRSSRAKQVRTTWVSIQRLEYCTATAGVHLTFEALNKTLPYG